MMHRIIDYATQQFSVNFATLKRFLQRKLRLKEEFASLLADFKFINQVSTRPVINTNILEWIWQAHFIVFHAWAQLAIRMVHTMHAKLTLPYPSTSKWAEHVLITLAKWTGLWGLNMLGHGTDYLVQVQEVAAKVRGCTNWNSYGTALNLINRQQKLLTDFVFYPDGWCVGVIFF